MGLQIPLILMAIRSIASQILFVSEPRGVMTTLCFFLYWLWFGIGVEYPLSATIMSEYTNKKTQVAFTITVFAMQGSGFWAVGSLLSSFRLLSVMRTMHNLIRLIAWVLLCLQPIIFGI